MTQAGFAAALGFSGADVCRVELGQRPASARMMREAARVLGVDEHVLFPDGR